MFHDIFLTSLTSPSHNRSSSVYSADYTSIIILIQVTLSCLLNDVYVSFFSVCPSHSWHFFCVQVPSCSHKSHPNHTLNMSVLLCSYFQSIILIFVLFGFEFLLAILAFNVCHELLLFLYRVLLFHMLFYSTFGSKCLITIRIFTRKTLFLIVVFYVQLVP